MRDLRSEILENKQLADGIYKMTLETPKSEFAKPGQFAMVEVPEKFLRRPISVSSYDSDRYTLIYKVVGGGTEILSKMEQGEHVRSITGLGNGYNIDDITDGAYIIGGGIGIPPMLGLLKTMVMSGKSCKVILGYNSADEMFMFDDFQQLADDITVMTADGSYGQKGFVTDAFSSCEYACACGPLPMLRAKCAWRLSAAVLGDIAQNRRKGGFPVRRFFKARKDPYSSDRYRIRLFRHRRKR